MEDRIKYFGVTGKSADSDIQNFYMVELGIIEANDLPQEKITEYEKWKHQHKWDAGGFCMVCGLNGNM